jgi:hypothetical protein
MGTRDRVHKRKPIQRIAWVVDHLGQRHSCHMSDVSDGGARLELPPGVVPPPIFVLSLAEIGKVHRCCEVRWRRGDAVGVRFISPQELNRLLNQARAARQPANA